DLKGREVGTRSAEPHDILAPACGEKPEIPKQKLGAITAKAQWSLVSKNWRMKLMCWFSAEHVNKIEEAKAGQRLGIKKMHWDRLCATRKRRRKNTSLLDCWHISRCRDLCCEDDAED